MKTLNKTLLLMAVMVIAISCKKNSQVEPETLVNNTSDISTNLLKIGETYILGAKAKAVVYSTKPFETGYNEVYISFIDSLDGTALTQGHVEMTPLMNMGTMVHAAPIENPTSINAINGYFKGAVVFIMTGTSSEWSLNISFHNHKNGLEGQGTLGVNVAASTPSKLKSTVISLDSSRKVYISLLSPKLPQVGINDFEITLHQKSSMMDFPFIDNYMVEIVPEMPSMGHGSPNNVNPVHIANGHYTGKVNYTMTGLWYIHLNIYKNGVMISNDQYFEMTVQ